MTNCSVRPGKGYAIRDVAINNANLTRDPKADWLTLGEVSVKKEGDNVYVEMSGNEKNFAALNSARGSIQNAFSRNLNQPANVQTSSFGLLFTIPNASLAVVTNALTTMSIDGKGPLIKNESVRQQMSEARVAVESTAAQAQDAARQTRKSFGYLPFQSGQTGIPDLQASIQRSITPRER